jgi:hypothetical protein
MITGALFLKSLYADRDNTTQYSSTKYVFYFNADLVEKNHIVQLTQLVQLLYHKLNFIIQCIL